MSTTRPRTIEGYAAELAAALPGPRRLRNDLVAEARDGLVDATEAYEAGGIDRRAAEQRAIEDFGDLDEIADAYRPELALAQSRRSAIGLTLVILIQPVVWADGRWPWNRSPDTGDGPWLHRFIEDTIQGAGFVMFVVAAIGIAACGIGVRRAGVRRSAARVTSVASLTSAVLLAVMSTCLGATSETGFTLTGVVWTTLFVMLPSVPVAVSARRALALTAA